MRAPLGPLSAAAVLVVLAAMLIPLGSTCGGMGLEDTESPHTENYTVSENTQVSVVAGDVDGDITVEAWTKDYVELTWSRRTTWGRSELETAEARVVQSPGRLDIGTTVSAEEVKLSLDYDIKLPQGVTLARVSSANGRTRIDGTRGDTVITAGTGEVSVKNTYGRLEIAAEKGNLRLEGAAGGARMATDAGAIEVLSSDGEVKAATGDGDISISGCSGDMTLETARGRIRVSDLDGRVLLARSSDGAIDVSGAAAIERLEASGAGIRAAISSVGEKGTTIKADDGSIDLYIASSVNADIELRSQSGEVSINSHTGTLSIAGELSPRLFTGVVGAGGNSLYVETTKGKVAVFGSDSGP